VASVIISKSGNYERAKITAIIHVRLPNGVLEFQNEAYPYKLTKGSTKSLLVHLLRQHIEPEDERVPVVEFNDQDKLFETKSAERWASKISYEDFLKRKANEREQELASSFHR
jgi:hypothetical protein